MDNTEQIARQLIGTEKFNQGQQEMKRNLLGDDDRADN
jgi:hypothetical protein